MVDHERKERGDQAKPICKAHRRFVLWAYDTTAHTSKQSGITGRNAHLESQVMFVSLASYPGPPITIPGSMNFDYVRLQFIHLLACKLTIAPHLYRRAAFL